MYTIKEAKEAIKKGIRGYLLKDENGKYLMKEANRLPFYLEGEPGIGKTEIVRQVADELKIGYVSFSLVHHTRNSLLGLPVIENLESGGKYTRYTMSEIIAKVLEQTEQGSKEGILLLDEFPSMSDTIVPTMLSFLQTKNIGTYTLPEGWVIVLCGNPPVYNKTAKTFDAAIMDRIRKLEVTFQAEVFLEYGKSVGMHEAVIEYLTFCTKHIYRYIQEKGKMELVTCRGWENVSHMLKMYEILSQEIDKEAVKQYLKSEEIAEAFYQFYVKYNTGINRNFAENIFNGIKIEKYVKQCTPMQYCKKYNLVEYMIGLLKSQYTSLVEEETLILEVKEMLKEIEQVIPTLSNDEILSPIFDPAVSELVSIIVEYSNIAFNTPERKKVLKQLEYFSTPLEEIFEEDEEVLENVKQVFETFYQKLTDWYNLERMKVYNLSKQAAEKVENMLKFIERIDSENMLAEMSFNQINQEPILLTILTKAPKETYLKWCENRYHMKAS